MLIFILIRHERTEEFPTLEINLLWFFFLMKKSVVILWESHDCYFKCNFFCLKCTNLKNNSTNLWSRFRIKSVILKQIYFPQRRIWTVGFLFLRWVSLQLQNNLPDESNLFGAGLIYKVRFEIRIRIKPTI